jgi:hypothetical protein
MCNVDGFLANNLLTLYYVCVGKLCSKYNFLYLFFYLQ